MGDVLSPACFLTTLQYTKIHGKESLGIIFPTSLTFPTFCKESTGYPALDPTANKYLSGSGWEIYVFSVFLFFFEFLFMFCVMCLYVFVRL